MSANSRDETTATNFSEWPASRSIFTASPRVASSSGDPDAQPEDGEQDHLFCLPLVPVGRREVSDDSGTDHNRGDPHPGAPAYLLRTEDLAQPAHLGREREQRQSADADRQQQWVFPQRFFRENLSLGEGGEEGRDNDILRETFERTGASVMGKRMFDAGEQMWPEEAPFHTPVFVVTHQKRDPWERPGGTTFHFVNDGVAAALDQARKAAGGRDVRIAGGGATILESVNAGLVDEFSIALSPVLFGSGITGFPDTDAEARIASERSSQCRTRTRSSVVELLGSRGCGRSRSRGSRRT